MYIYVHCTLYMYIAHCTYMYIYVHCGMYVHLYVCASMYMYVYVHDVQSSCVRKEAAV